MSGLSQYTGTPWALTPAYLYEFQRIHSCLKNDIESLSSKFDFGGIKLDTQRGVDIHDDVAVIHIDGVIVKRMDIITRIFGGVATERVMSQVNAVLHNPKINAIILNIDSPGGTVDGTFELANHIHMASKRKKMVALADGMMASAAYAIGSATGSVYIRGETTQVGSIGVVATHVDTSESERMRGIRVTEICTGKYKCIASSHRPLTDEGREEIQSRVDYMYSVFVDSVAQYRDVPANKVLADMADGRLFFGASAIQSGLADGFSSVPKLISELTRAKAA